MGFLGEKIAKVFGNSNRSQQESIDQETRPKPRKSIFQRLLRKPVNLTDISSNHRITTQDEQSALTFSQPESTQHTVQEINKTLKLLENTSPILHKYLTKIFQKLQTSIPEGWANTQLGVLSILLGNLLDKKQKIDTDLVLLITGRIPDTYKDDESLSEICECMKTPELNDKTEFNMNKGIEKILNHFKKRIYIIKSYKEAKEYVERQKEESNDVVQNLKNNKKTLKSLFILSYYNELLESKDVARRVYITPFNELTTGRQTPSSKECMNMVLQLCESHETLRDLILVKDTLDDAIIQEIINNTDPKLFNLDNKKINKIIELGVRELHRTLKKHELHFDNVFEDDSEVKLDFIGVLDILDYIGNSENDELVISDLKKQVARRALSDTKKDDVDSELILRITAEFYAEKIHLKASDIFETLKGELVGSINYIHTTLSDLSKSEVIKNKLADFFVGLNTESVKKIEGLEGLINSLQEKIESNKVPLTLHELMLINKITAVIPVVQPKEVKTFLTNNTDVMEIMKKVQSIFYDEFLVNLDEKVDEIDAKNEFTVAELEGINLTDYDFLNSALGCFVTIDDKNLEITKEYIKQLVDVLNKQPNQDIKNFTYNNNEDAIYDNLNRDISISKEEFSNWVKKRILQEKIQIYKNSKIEEAVVEVLDSLNTKYGKPLTCEGNESLDKNNKDKLYNLYWSFESYLYSRIYKSLSQNLVSASNLDGVGKSKTDRIKWFFSDPVFRNTYKNLLVKSADNKYTDEVKKLNELLTELNKKEDPVSLSLKIRIYHLRSVLTSNENGSSLYNASESLSFSVHEYKRSIKGLIRKGFGVKRGAIKPIRANKFPLTKGQVDFEIAILTEEVEKVIENNTRGIALSA